MRARLTTAFLATGLLIAAPAALADDDLTPYAKAIEANPDDAKVYDAYGTKAVMMKRYDDAIAKLKVGVARVPDFGKGYYLLAVSFRAKQSWADAADYYRRCIMLKQKENESYYGLGKSLAGLGDKKGATAALRKYIALEKRPEAQRFIDDANAEIAKLEPPPAPPPSSGGLTGGIGTSPSGPATGLRAEADNLKKAGRFDEAAVAYKRAIEGDRDNLDLYNDLGNVYFALKRYNDAAQAFKDATGRDQNYALGWYNLAHALRKADRKGEAVDAYKRYIRLKPEDPDPYYGLGQTLKALGDVPGAITAFHKYIDMEKRPDEQKWVEKARQELAAMEVMQKSPPSSGSGKISDEKSTFQGAEPVPALERPLGRVRDLHDPFEGMPAAAPADGAVQGDGLIDPFARPKAPRDEAPAVGPKEVLPPLSEGRVRDYGRAISAYRRALAAHVEDVAVRYERGVASAMAGKPRDAIAAWNTIALDDARVQAAKRGVEVARR
jgi:tetratricopeptide (TPR) repeat protein